MTKIFGYDWDDIKRAQQGDMSGLHRPVSNSPSDNWTQEDQEALDKFKTIAGLEAAGLYGVADRARRLGKAIKVARELRAQVRAELERLRAELELKEENDKGD